MAAEAAAAAYQAAMEATMARNWEIISGEAAMGVTDGAEMGQLEAGKAPEQKRGGIFGWSARP